MAAAKYDHWTREELVARLTQLDLASSRTKREARNAKVASFRGAAALSFVPGHFPRRKIALKFAYSGWLYNGLAAQTDPTPLPTVEAVLFAALGATRLVDPARGMEGCGWARCGRTDAGVSAAGQVVNLWIRTALGSEEVLDADEPTEEPELHEFHNTDEPAGAGDEHGPDSVDDLPSTADADAAPAPPSTRHEFPYVAMLNRALPPSIRILAWSPVSPSFSARFSCQARHYKYFFLPGALSLPRMREGAALLLGEHDFRNFCKLDAAKQIASFRRRILRADIADADGASVCVLDLVGTAFLRHQVRHIMAVLLLVGARLEPPSTVRALLNVHPGAEPDALAVVACKPSYEMADALPLVLWDCSYAPGDVAWRAEPAPAAPDPAPGYLLPALDSAAARARIEATLLEHFVLAAAAYHAPPIRAGGAELPLGGGRSRASARYVPLLERPRQEDVEMLNERWRVGKGARRAERRAEEAAAPETGGE